MKKKGEKERLNISGRGLEISYFERIRVSYVILFGLTDLFLSKEEIFVGWMKMEFALLFLRYF